jgi:hypothetical protein
MEETLIRFGLLVAHMTVILWNAECDMVDTVAMEETLTRWTEYQMRGQIWNF